MVPICGLALGMGVMLFFAVTMGMELLQETGQLEIKPHTEYWTSISQHE